MAIIGTPTCMAHLHVCFYISMHAHTVQSYMLIIHSLTITNWRTPPHPPLPGYGDVLMFPQDPTPTKYFSNKLDFVSINGSLLVGAA